MNTFLGEENSPSASFQKLCQNMLDGNSRNLTRKNVEDFRVILHMIMHECSKANIEVKTQQRIAPSAAYLAVLDWKTLGL